MDYILDNSAISKFNFLNAITEIYLSRLYYSQEINAEIYMYVGGKNHRK